MAKQIFRQVALERLSSPDQLDALLTVTGPKGWIGLAALGILVVAAVVWGVRGTIPMKVHGNGILIRSGGVHDIQSGTAGTITAIYHTPGNPVKKGQIVARIAQPDLIEKINNALGRMKELSERRDRTRDFGTTDLKMQKASLQQKRKGLYQSIESSGDQVKNLAERLNAQKEVLDQGLITKQSYLQTAQDIERQKRQIVEYRNQLKLLDIQEHQLKEDASQAVIRIDQEIHQLERELGTMERNREKTTKVVSPYTGKVLEVVAREGQMVPMGSPILRLELTGNDVTGLEAVIFMPPDKGKRVKPGYEIQISPGTVAREEYGFMLGLVTQVAQYPATRERMMNVLQNAALVDTLSMGSAPIEVHADMIPSSRTYSGYQWSSAGGPAMRINSGTLCAASVTVEKKAPVEYVIPMFRKFILGVGR